MKRRQMFVTVVLCAAALAYAAPAGAQQQPQAPQPPPQQRDPDQDLDPLQPDFRISSLPTTLRVPRFKSAFAVTHRFGRPLGSGDFGDLAADFFGLDSSALIGLEYRFGLMRGLQVGVYRTNDRVIELFTQYSLMQQAESRPVGIGILGVIDGSDNFTDSYSPALGVLVSRKIGRIMDVYAEPIWVNNSNRLPSELVDHNSTFMLGLGARVKILRSVNLVGEVAPRPAGFDPGRSHIGFGVEKVIGGHVFQLNFSNSVGTTISALARGGESNEDWFLGFNITRKFWR